MNPGRPSQRQARARSSWSNDASGSGGASTAPHLADAVNGDRSESDLDDGLDPVEAVGVTEPLHDERADEGGHDPDENRQPDGDVLLARNDEAPERADDEADDEG